MNSLIVCASVSHGNTRKVADVVGEVLGARIVDPAHLDPHDIAGTDLVGFASGIFYGSFHTALRDFVRALPPRTGKAFVLSTSGFPETRLSRPTHAMTRLLTDKGFDVLDTLSIRAWDTFAPFRLVGGLHKGRPDATDLETAHAFATRLRTRIAS